ncbi:MAG: YegS/Rv2252/BmrU family lipid kinase [Candidatus Brocadiaceae bacterium]|jgi:YegS/Rv2252/BmrU family lipid kinase
MRRFDQVLLVANPTSGLGKARRWVDRVAGILRPLSTGPVRVVRTRDAGDGRRAVSGLEAPNALAVAFGGDGTFNELLNGADLGRCTLAIVPAGTGNVLAKELGMSRRPSSAARQLINGRRAALDVGLCNGRRFVSVFGAGLDGRAVQLVHEGRGGGLTQIHYIPHVIRSLVEAHGFRIEVEADGRRLTEGACQVSVGNTHSYGGPMEMTPAANPSDGLLDVMCLRLRNVEQAVGLTARALLRALHRANRSATYTRARRIRVSAGGGEVPYEVDGEAAGFLPAEIGVVPAAAHILAPRSFAPRRTPVPPVGGRETG